MPVHGPVKIVASLQGRCKLHCNRRPEPLAECPSACMPGPHPLCRLPGVLRMGRRGRQMRWSGRHATPVTLVTHSPIPPRIPLGHAISQRTLGSLERFLKIEAASGIVLVIAAVIALSWANSWLADSYHVLWATPVTLGIGEFVVTRTLQFIVNDGLMTVFFLVVGMEIRREMHNGALSDLNQASLPIIAAL